MKFALAMLIVISSSTLAYADTSTDDVLREMKSFASAGDELGLRLAAKLLPNLNGGATVSREQWMIGRRLLHKHPAVGWDILLKWDKPARTTLDASDTYIDRGDKLLKEKNFEAAFSAFQKAAQILKKNSAVGDNDLLYFNVLHSMARSLYGAKNFNDAVTVYGWIPTTYPFFRQVLFERMWSAFRAEQFDIANGSIAAQYSSYFSRYPDPETFLVQIYLYKKLCRTNDLKQVYQQAVRYRNELKKNTYTYLQWAQVDHETRVYLQLASQKSGRSSELISTADRDKERVMLRKRLQERFESMKPTLLSQIELVITLAKDAYRTKAPELAQIKDLGSERFQTRELEMWPVDDAEDWLDELGHHLFIGVTQCRGG